MSIRTAFAVALAALVAFPAAAATRTRRGTAPSTATAAPAQTTTTEASPVSRSLWVGATVGLEVNERWSGFALSMDAELVLGRLTPKLSLSGIGAFAWSRLSRDAVGIESSWNLLEATPGARLTLAAAPKLGVYGEAGVGLFFGRFAYSWSFPTPGETGRNELGPSMRFGAGGLYDLNSRMRLEAGISVGRYFGDVHATTWILSVGGMVGT